MRRGSEQVVLDGGNLNIKYVADEMTVGDNGSLTYQYDTIKSDSLY